jgi:hypothetical protein
MTGPRFSQRKEKKKRPYNGVIDADGIGHERSLSANPEPFEPFAGNEVRRKPCSPLILSPRVTLIACYQRGIAPDEDMIASTAQREKLLFTLHLASNSPVRKRKFQVRGYPSLNFTEVIPKAPPLISSSAASV